MPHKYNILILLILLTLLFSAPGFAPENQALSEAEFSSILHRYQSFSSLKTSFTQIKTITDLGIQLKSEGTLSINRPSTVIWQVLKPGPLTVTINDKQVSMENETFLLSSAPSKVSQKLALMISWLKMDTAKLYENFSILRLRENVYRLTPRQKKSDAMGIGAFEITLNSQGYVERVLITEVSGDLLEILFLKPKVS